MTIGRRYSSIIRSVTPDSVSNNENDNAKPRGHIGWIGNRFDYIISKLKETPRSRKTENLLSISNSSSNVSNKISAKSKRNHRSIRLALSITVVSILVFLYLFTFLVWSQLSIEDIQSQADTENEWNVPWYLYPMKLGLTGLLGLVFLLSYLFRKFEKEIFVFVLIAVIALFAGPYYDEHRFSKYIMAGMASLAALLIYEIISKARVHSASMPRHLVGVKYFMGSGSKLKVVVGGILLGLVVTFSSLSIFVFAGFVELFTNVPDYNENTRRDFPTHSEMQLLDFLRVGLSAKNTGENYNVALPAKEVDNNRGLLTKIYGFTSLPRAKLLQTPLVLNSSTVETFYNLLDYSDSKFIVLPNKYLTGNMVYSSNKSTTFDSVNFALDNFRKVFKNDVYTVLEVPNLSPPSTHGNIALVYPKNESIIKEETYSQHYYPLSMLALRDLAYNTYVEGDLSAFSKKYVILTYDPPIRNAKLPTSLSEESNYTSVGVNSHIYLDYVRDGGNLIIIDSNYGRYETNETGQGIFGRLFSISPTGNYARFDALSSTTDLHSLKGAPSQKGPCPSGNSEQIEQDALMRNPINISGKVEEIRYGSKDNRDDNICVESYYTAENNSNNGKTGNSIVTPFVIQKKYGNGKIIYVNANGYIHTLLAGSSLSNNSSYDIYPNNSRARYFSTLGNITNTALHELEAKERPGYKGFLNSATFPGEISKAPKIRQILDNVQISSGYKTRINSSSLLLPVTNNSYGDFAAKEVTFASSFPGSSMFSNTNFSTGNVAAYELSRTKTADSSSQGNSKSNENSKNEYDFRNVEIKNLTLYGSYEVIVETNDSRKVTLPAFPSFSDYVAMTIPKGFNMTIKLSDNEPSYAEFDMIVYKNDISTNTNGTFERLRVYGDGAIARGVDIANINSKEIRLLNTSSSFASNGYTSLLMKSPQFQVYEDGDAAGVIKGNFTEDGFRDDVNAFLAFKSNSLHTEPIKIQNKADINESVIFRIDYVDNYFEPYNQGKKSHSLTYLEEDVKAIEDNLNNDGNEKNGINPYTYRTDTQYLKFPGDISERAKKQGIEVNLQKMLISDRVLLLVILIIIAAVSASKIAIRMNSRTTQGYENNR